LLPWPMRRGIIFASGEPITVRRDDQRAIRMLRKHPLLNDLDSSLSAVITSEPVTFAGAWQPATRRTYRDLGQHGKGTGALVEVVDVEWTGSLTSKVPIVCVGFLLTRDMLFWVKSAPADVSQPVTVSLTASADYSLLRAILALDKATFAPRVGDAFLPGVPVPRVGDLSQACTLGVAEQFTGRVFSLAGAHDVSFLVLTLPGSVVKVGRNRLWHLRDTLAPLLPRPVRDLLTRRRSGNIPADARGN
jgi:hypothetical protein